MSNEKKTGRQRYIIALLLVICAGPLLVSWWLLNFTDFGRKGSGMSHGQLIQPLRPLPNIELYNPASNTQTRLHGKWSLVYVVNNRCDKACEEGLYKMRQLRLATGKYARRVQRVLMVFGGNRDILSSEAVQVYRGQLLAYQGRAGQDNNVDVQKFAIVENETPTQLGRLYVVDPLGNLMMAYDAQTDPSGIIKDLKRLLKYSQVG